MEVKIRTVKIANASKKGDFAMKSAEKVKICQNKDNGNGSQIEVGTSIATKVLVANMAEGDISAVDAVASKKEKSVQIATQRNAKTAKRDRILQVK